MKKRRISKRGEIDSNDTEEDLSLDNLAKRQSGHTDKPREKVSINKLQKQVTEAVQLVYSAMKSIELSLKKEEKVDENKLAVLTTYINSYEKILKILKINLPPEKMFEFMRLRFQILNGLIFEYRKSEVISDLKKAYEILEPYFPE